MGLRDVLRHAAALGPRAAGYRAAWEAQNRSGLRQLLEPAGAVPIPPDLPSFHEWSRDWPPHHPLRHLRDHARTADHLPDDDALMQRARRACDGAFTLFGHLEIHAGSPPAFTSEPLAQKAWPDVHWSRTLRANIGDPRTTWELNRFGWVWDWIRAYARQPVPQWAMEFAGHLTAWETQNPFRVGINWVSGQELALRAITWCAGAAVFGDTPGFIDDDFRRLWKLVYWHAFQIDAQLDFARLAVPNNHLLAESLALAIIGDLATSAPNSNAWKQRGLQLFRDAIQIQFRPDGGYCQNSHRYHRYALELLILADRWFPSLHPLTTPILTTNLDYFRAMRVTPNAGHIPNFGPNDGATAFHLTPCPDHDIRPLLATMAARLGQSFESGPWDEQVEWLGLGLGEGGREGMGSAQTRQGARPLDPHSGEGGREGMGSAQTRQGAAPWREELGWIRRGLGDEAEAVRRRRCRSIVEEDGERIVAQDRRRRPKASRHGALPLDSHSGEGGGGASFGASGVHVLRWDSWAVFLRCGAAARRGGHADQLHVDVWCDGEGIAIDAGSGRYFDAEHTWFVGTAAHNTVTVDGRGQQRLLSRFTWADDAPARLVEFEIPSLPEWGSRGLAPWRGVGRSPAVPTPRQTVRATGRTEGYLELGVLHERSVVVTGEGVTVVDRLTPVDAVRRRHAFRLHWLIPVVIDEVLVGEASDCFTWNISTGAADFRIAASTLAGSKFDARLEVVPSKHAPAYGAVAPASSIVVEARGHGVKFVTTIGRSE